MPIEQPRTGGYCLITDCTAGLVACEAGGLFEERSETVQPPNRQPQPKQPMSRKRKIAIGGAVVVCAPALIAGMINGARQSLAGGQASATPVAGVSSTTPAAPAPARSSAQASKPVAEPTFSYAADPECSITYRDRGDGSMTWTATVTKAGELITHASDASGNIYRRDVQVTPGPNDFAAPVPLSTITDIGGVLTAGGATYGCSVAPAH